MPRLNERHQSTNQKKKKKISQQTPSDINLETHTQTQYDQTA